MKRFKLKKWNLKQYNWGKLGLELLVVFLGVSSGFLLNNWREENQQLKLEQKYISGFLSDVEDNIEELKKLNTSDSLWVVAVNRNIPGLQKGELSQDSCEVLMNSIFRFDKVQMVLGTYEDIKNSGNLNLIRNFELKGMIVDYGLEVEGVKFIDDYFFEFFNDNITTFIFSEFDVINGKIKDEEIYKSLTFSNLIAGYYSNLLQRSQAYKKLLSKSIEFKEALLKEQGHPE